MFENAALVHEIFFSVAPTFRCFRLTKRRWLGGMKHSNWIEKVKVGYLRNPLSKKVGSLGQMLGLPTER
jgi:hypothetical protein